MTTTKHMARAFGVAFAASLALVSGASGQSDDAWFAYLGCWEPVDGAGPALCIRPTLDGVELTRVADGEIVGPSRTTVAASS